MHAAMVGGYSWLAPACRCGGNLLDQALGLALDEIDEGGAAPPSIR
ncbi:MAG: hypothetical protein JXA78_14250 [Anaerolineales bacterium]|nr:hypothetical protein [Anaerolineales bacterium]